MAMKKTYIHIIKQFNILCLAATLIMSCGCARKSNIKDESVLQVVTVNFAQYDFARAVCGDRAEVKMIIRPGAEVHGYEPSLSDIMAIENADVFIYGGGEGDSWVKRIMASVDTSDTISVPTMYLPGIHLYKEEIHTLAHKEDEHHHGEAHFDEHIWTSPKNAIAMVRGIESAIAKADGGNKAYYQKNADEYISRLQIIDSDLTRVASSGKCFIAVADRFPFLYLAKDYAMDYLAAFSGCSPEGDAGPSVVASMTDEIIKRKLDYVFHIELSNQKMADAICEYTGVRKRLLHSCQSVSRYDFESGVTYADLMEKNLINLSEVTEN